MYFFFAVKGKVQEIMILSILCQWRSRHSCFGGLIFFSTRNLPNNLKFGFSVFVCIIIIGREGKLKWLRVGKISAKRKIWTPKIILHRYKALLAGIVNVPNFGKFNLFFFLLREPLLIFLSMYLRFLDYPPLGNVLVYHLPLGPGIGSWNENTDIVVDLHLSTALISIQKQLSGLLDRKKTMQWSSRIPFSLKIEHFFLLLSQE